MNQKPIITYHGDQRLLTTLSPAIYNNLPQEPKEWRRSYGRPPKTVYVDAKFVPFHDDVLPEVDSKSLIKYAFFHTYWTECYDLDAYKATVKDDISNWITKLKARNISDWLIVCVENVDGKKGNKKLLSRTTVHDKVKSDFASRQSDKCIALLDPYKSDSRAAGSWSALLERIRNLLLQAYNKVLGKFEENMRSQREHRNDPGWNFCDYFLLQEELAFVYETLGLYDDALLQYDELDALFTQFVLNSVAGETPDWLLSFCKPCECWTALTLSPSDRVLSNESRNMIIKHEISLLELRNYLFCHQCSLLLLLSKPWEVAQRALPFMHNCVYELSLLEISMPRGSVACWVFLTCMEVLQSCQRFNDSIHIEKYSLFTADIWAYARNKLHELGILCGLMPDLTESSEQLHMVVQLGSGMGMESSESDAVVQSPRAKLKESLSSRSAFQKYYLEMSELAMGTYKHIGRIRSARLVGIDLARFYMKLKEPLKASVFFSDALKTYKEENWPSLAMRTQLELVAAYEFTEETTKYIKACAQLASSDEVPGLDRQQKLEYFNKMVASAKTLNSGENLLMKINEMFTISNLRVGSEVDNVVKGNEVCAFFKVISAFPESLESVSIQISLKYNKSLEEMTSEKKKLQKRDSWGFFPSHYSAPYEETKKETLDFFQHCEYTSNTVSSSSIMCRNSQTVLSHSDSHHWIMKAREPCKEHVSLSMDASNLIIQPGLNDVTIKITAGEAGVYTLDQLSIVFCNMEFILAAIYPSCSFNVITEEPSVKFEPLKSSLICGINENVNVLFKCGSQPIDNDTLDLRTSTGLTLQDAETKQFHSQTSIHLQSLKPFETMIIPIKLYAAFKVQKESNCIEHRVTITSSKLIPQPYSSILSFNQPFQVICKCHSAFSRKFIQVVVHGSTKLEFTFKGAKLVVEDSKVENLLVSFNASDQQLVVSANQQVSYMWEVAMTEITPEIDALKFNFTANYKPSTGGENCDSWKVFCHEFKISNLKTIYILRSRIEPLKGSEFCRANGICTMHIQINQIEKENTPKPSLMYEVIADQSMWTICGKASGVLTIGSSNRYDVALDAKPLVGGFLPLPTVRLSRYIQSENAKFETVRSTSNEPNNTTSAAAKLKPFSPGQVYNASRAIQVHVLPATSSTNTDIPLP